ncbi:MAG TPA: terminase family protein [Rhodopila sp.]
MGQEPARHHNLLIRELEAIASGENDRLMVFLPPGSAKSTYVSDLFPPWWFCRHPRSTVIAASHTAALAQSFGRRTRNRVSSNVNVLGYGLRRESTAARNWLTTAGGEYIAIGVRGSITGRRADLGIIDDPVKSQIEAESSVNREAILEWYRSDFYTRLKPGGRIILVMTRWHEEDLGGTLLNEMEQGGDQWRVLKLPALAVDADDPLGRAVGAPLWPEWEDAEAIARKRRALGERQFGALFQQDPRPKGTSFFDEADLLIEGEPIEMPARVDSVFATMDTAIKTGTKNDGTGVIYWGLTNNATRNPPLVVLDWDIVQVQGALLENWLPSVNDNLELLVRATGARMGSLGVQVEDKGSGTILLQKARLRNWDAHELDSKLTAMGKDERAISVNGNVSRGDVKVTRHAYDKMTTYKGRSANHFRTQVFRFQIGVKDQADDLLDCFCYGISFALGDPDGYGA